MQNSIKVWWIKLLNKKREWSWEANSFASNFRWWGTIHLYLDSMAIIRCFEKSDLFITFTCNLRWSEVTHNLAEHQKPLDRPKIMTRVFQMKLKEFKNDIMERGVFGEVIRMIYTIEFQNRGLPHYYMLLILKIKKRIRTSNDYKNFASKEFQIKTMILNYSKQ